MFSDANLVSAARPLSPGRAWSRDDIAGGCRACGRETSRRLQSAGVFPGFSCAEINSDFPRRADGRFPRRRRAAPRKSRNRRVRAASGRAVLAWPWRAIAATEVFCKARSTRDHRTIQGTAVHPRNSRCTPAPSPFFIEQSTHSSSPASAFGFLSSASRYDPTARGCGHDCIPPKWAATKSSPPCRRQ